MTGPSAYTLDATSSTVRFTAHEIGRAVPGTMAVRSGRVVAGPDGVDVTAVLDAASFTTGHPRRDGTVRSAHFLDVEQYPEMHVTGHWSGRAGDPMTGELTVRTVTVAVDVEITQQEGRHVRARARIDRTAFGVGPRFGIPIRRHLEIDLDIVLVTVPVTAGIVVR